MIKEYQPGAEIPYIPVSPKSASSSQLRLSEERAQELGIRQFQTPWVVKKREPVSDSERRAISIKGLCERTGVEREKMEKLDRIEHNLVHELLECGNKGMAMEIAKNPSLVRERRPDLLRSIADLRYVYDVGKQRPRGWDPIPREEVADIIEEIQKDQEKWEAELKDTLTNLRLE